MLIMICPIREKISPEVPVSSWFYPGLISTVSSVFALSLNAGLGVYSRIAGSLVGIATVAYGTEYAAAILSEGHEKIDQIIQFARNSKNESISNAIKFSEYLKKVDYQLTNFVDLLDVEQFEKLFSLLKVYELLEEGPVEVDETLARAFVLSQKQTELLNAFFVIFPEEKRSGLKLLCKFFTASQQNQLKELDRFLELRPQQKQLFKELVFSVEEMSEEVIYLAIHAHLQAKLCDKVLNHFTKLSKAKVILIFSAPLSALLTILHPSHLIGVVHPLSAIWAILQGGSLLIGAMTIGYIFYQCIFSQIPEEIRHEKNQILELNSLA